MTEEINGTIVSSTVNDESDCVGNNLKSNDIETIQNVIETDGCYVLTENIASESLVTEKVDNVSDVNMTKNKDREQSTKKSEEERISPASEKCELLLENEQHENSEEKAENNATLSSIEKQPSIEKVDDQIVTEDIHPQSSIEDEASEINSEDVSQPLNEKDKFHPSTFSVSRWTDTYDSLDNDDEKPIEAVGDDPKKLILWAAEKNEVETLRKLLEEDPSLVNARDNDLYTPLHRASYSNNVEVIKILLSFDADISSKTADGWEPLHCACKWDSVEAVSLLLQNGADVNARTKGNITPLHLAAANLSGRRTLELLLWQPYIDPNIKNDADDTAYDIAYRSGPLGALFEILEESVNVY